MIARPSSAASSRILGNLRFSVLVIGALIIFTLIASTYHPQGSKISNFLASDSDATFKSDVGLVKTGDDLLAATATIIDISDVESAVAQFQEPAVVLETSDCRADEPIDCRDPDVFHSLMKAAMAKFSDIHFYRFGKPVRGDNASSCHMPWRFKPKEGKAADRFYKDYRTFNVVRFDNCTVSVVGIGEYHSGGNARKRKGGNQGMAKGKGNALGLFDIGEAANDALPIVESELSFIRAKYLVYSGGGDRCKSMNQYLWSFMCMLGEAQFLNRTLVMDLSICLSKMYSSSGVDEEGKDFRFYFDFDHLKDSASVLGQAQFWSEWNKWQHKNGLKLHLVEDSKFTPMKLVGVEDTLIMRKFGSVEPENCWYQVCEGEVESVVHRPWHMIWKSKRLVDAAAAIAARMNWDFDAMHVERGEKASNRELWPNLDRDTQPEALLKTLQNKVEDGRNLYIATNEPDTSIFNPLKDGKYSVHFLDDYKHLWDVNSEWYNEMMKLNSGNSVEFDGYMRISVDTEVFLRGKKQIETFNDLTKDCKDGINTCTTSTG